MSAVVVFDFGQARAIDSLYARMATSGGFGIQNVAYSVNGTDWTVLNKGIGAPGSAAYVTLSLGGLYTARYWAVQFLCYETAWLNVYEVKGQQVTRYISSVLQSTTKSLDFSPSQVVLHLSIKTPSDSGVTALVSCDGGSHWEALTLSSSRTDPLYSDYTEKKYSLTPSYPGSQLILKATLSPSGNQYYTPEIKRYGLYFS